MEFRLLLQVDQGWSEKGSECICKGNLETGAKVDLYMIIFVGLIIFVYIHFVS